MPRVDRTTGTPTFILYPFTVFILIQAPSLIRGLNPQKHLSIVVFQLSRWNPFVYAKCTEQLSNRIHLLAIDDCGPVSVLLAATEPHNRLLFIWQLPTNRNNMLYIWSAVRGNLERLWSMIK